MGISIAVGLLHYLFLLHFNSVAVKYVNKWIYF